MQLQVVACEERGEGGQGGIGGPLQGSDTVRFEHTRMQRARGGQHRLRGWDQSAGLKGLGRAWGLVGTESARTAVTLSSTCCWKCLTVFRASRSPPSLVLRKRYRD